MQGNYFEGESSIGLVAHGGVHTQNLVLNIGGQPHALYEIDTDVLEAKRVTIEAAITHRKRIVSISGWIFIIATLAMWSVLPQEIQKSNIDPAIIGFVTLALLAGTAFTAWHVVHVQMGRWRRRNRLTIKQLELVLAQLDAELDMRRPASDFSLWAAIRRIPLLKKI